MANVTGFKQWTHVKMEVTPVTGSTTPIRDPFTWLVFANTSTTAAQTVSLPLLPTDGQQLLISNVSAITAFTLSPTTLGWTNATALAAGQGMFLAYSSTMNSGAGSWFVANF